MSLTIVKLKTDRSLTRDHASEFWGRNDKRIEVVGDFDWAIESLGSDSRRRDSLDPPEASAASGCGSPQAPVIVDYGDGAGSSAERGRE